MDNDSTSRISVGSNITSQLITNGYGDYNASAVDYDMNAMARIFAMRFVAYTIFAAVCVSFNLVSLVALRFRRGNKTVHHMLLENLAVCDLLGSVLLWMYYNSPHIYPRFEVTSLRHCLFKLLALVAPFILSLTSSMLSLLMLGLNQYMAICNPFISAAHITKGKVFVVICVSWVLAAFFAVLPGILVVVMSSLNTLHCRQYAASFSVRAIEICSYALACMIVIIVCLYIKIYRIIVNYRKYSPANIRRNRASNTENNYKAFLTTLLLTGTLVIFWLPFVAFHFMSHLVDHGNLPLYVYFIKLYFIDFLPMFIFVLDPLIYGVRIVEIRASYKRLFSRLFPCCCADAGSDALSGKPTRSSGRFTMVDRTSSI